VYLEDYEDAARLKVAFAAAANNDSVGRVMSYLNVIILTTWCFFGSQSFSILATNFCAFFFHNPIRIYILNLFVSFPNFQRAIKEERYGDAAFLRDKAGAGLVSSDRICLMQLAWISLHSGGNRMSDVMSKGSPSNTCSSA